MSENENPNVSRNQQAGQGWNQNAGPQYSPQQYSQPSPQYTQPSPQYTQPAQQSAQTDEQDALRIQDLMYLCLAKWKWFVLSLAVCIGLAVVYILRTPPVYTRTASVLIKEDSKGKSISSDLGDFSNLGLFQSNTNVNKDRKSVV